MAETTKTAKAKAPAAAKATKTVKPKADAAAKGTAKPNALQTPVEVSDDLAVIVGKGPMARSEVTSKVWDYIKSNKLQSEKDKRQIDPDAKLGKVIGKESISMFKMTAAVSKHLGAKKA